MLLCNYYIISQACERIGIRMVHCGRLYLATPQVVLLRCHSENLSARNPAWSLFYNSLLRAKAQDDRWSLIYSLPWRGDISSRLGLSNSDSTQTLFRPLSLARYKHSSARRMRDSGVSSSLHHATPTLTVIPSV